MIDTGDGSQCRRKQSIDTLIALVTTEEGGEIGGGSCTIDRAVNIIVDTESLVLNEGATVAITLSCVN